ncbi:MAG TPA: DinB family protein [Candidatus Limnocylindrales bacterium]|nr:DinB family protein [Candidatus Limnocylindrales bacterium]
MAEVVQSLLRPAEGFRSREAASFYAQLEDQARILRESIQGMTPQELEWQPERGMNTIGMLLAHNAIVDVFWTQLAILGIVETDSMPALGISMDDDGMPLAPDAEGPANLKGKPLAYYEDLLARGRALVKEAWAKVSDADMDKQTTRERPDGSKRLLSVRWAMYHILEHYAGHRGQIQLLRHLYSATVGSPSR